MQGIIVGSDQNQEWMLPWWWEKYRRYNAFPVAFFDFGMSKKGRKWCQERGEIISLPAFKEPSLKTDVSRGDLEKWKAAYDEGIWIARPGWFRKPQAMLRSPFETSIWIDLDCEILGDLSPLFPYGPFAVAKDLSTSGINTGVVVFEKNEPLLEHWAKLCEEESHKFPGDQDVLNHLLKKKKISILPQIYNWRMQLGENPEVVILHWVGPFGKEIIHLKSMAQL